MELVTVYTAFNPTLADLIASRLEVSRFHPVVQHAGAALGTDGYGLAVGGILVQVPENEAEEVRAFLAAANDEPTE